MTRLMSGPTLKGLRMCVRARRWDCRGKATWSLSDSGAHTRGSGRDLAVKFKMASWRKKGGWGEGSELYLFYSFSIVDPPHRPSIARPSPRVVEWVVSPVKQAVDLSSRLASLCLPRRAPAFGLSACAVRRLDFTLVGKRLVQVCRAVRWTFEESPFPRVLIKMMI